MGMPTLYGKNPIVLHADKHARFVGLCKFTKLKFAYCLLKEKRVSRKVKQHQWHLI
jgi:hypothetical protein